LLVRYVEDNDPEAERQSLIAAQRAAEWQQVEADHEFNSSLISDREDAIKKLQGEMVEVHEIFRDLATLVGEQGEMISTGICQNISLFSASTN
jgi:t-SNARE complex subunit (syntaxin)